MLDLVPPDSHAGLVSLLRPLQPVDQARVRVLLEVLEVRQVQERWRTYWLMQCELLSTAFLLNAEVVDRAEAFCRGASLSAFVCANSSALARMHVRDEQGVINLLVACHAVVPALLMGELAAQSWERTIGAIAEGQVVRVQPNGAIDRGLQSRATDVRGAVMTLLGYDEAYAKQVSIRPGLQALRHLHP